MVLSNSLHHDQSIIAIEVTFQNLFHVNPNKQLIIAMPLDGRPMQLHHALKY